MPIHLTFITLFSLYYISVSIKELIILLLIIPMILMSNCQLARKCNRTPEGVVAQKSPADGRFMIKIHGNKENYTADEDYKSELV